MFSWTVVVALVLGLATPAEASDSQSTSLRSLQPLDLFDLSLASAPAVQPQAKFVAYVRVKNDIMTDSGRKTIWLVDLRTRLETQVSSGDGAVTQPSWSVDGERIAYVQAGPSGNWSIMTYNMASHATTEVTKVTRSPDRLAWSPDGLSIAFIMAEVGEPPKLGTALVPPAGAKWAAPLQVTDSLMYRDDGSGPRQPGMQHMFVVAATGGTPRQVTNGRYEDAGPLSWTPDGTGVVFTSRRGKDWEREPFHAGIYRVTVADGTLTTLATPDAPHLGARLSPDGKRIAYASYDDRYRGYENARLYVMYSDGGHAHALTTAIDRSFENPIWSRDGTALYGLTADSGRTNVARIDASSGVMTRTAQGLAGDGFDLPYTGGEFAVGGDGVLAFTQGATDRPPDLAVAYKGKTQRLTHLNDTLLKARTLGTIRPITVASSFDGAPVGAWIVLPPGFDARRKYPLILEIHGGPFASYGPTFATDDQLYAAAGYVVVYANPRGSTSYGDKFANGIDRSYPGVDYDDLMSTVDAAVATGFVDKDRLFVTGGSGGGVLTAWIVGKTHRFRAAASQKPVVNWSSEVLTSDIYPWMAKYWFGKMPWEDPQSYWARSPLSLVGNITTPTLVVVGDQDVRTPVPEAEQLYGALQMRGIPTALVKVPGAFHDMAQRPSQAGAKAATILAWFARYGGTGRAASE